MRAQVLEKLKEPLILKEIDAPKAGPRQVEIEVLACAVCRTDLHIIDGELPEPKLPLILGHQIVGKIASKSSRFAEGTVVGVPWLGRSCGECPYCQQQKENLCDAPVFTGYTRNGGYAERCVADEPFIFPIPKGYTPEHAAPLLCAGMIGYRSWRPVAKGERIGFYGFGAAAHLLIQLALHEGKKVYAFTRPGDTAGKNDALARGALWAGGSDETPPEPLDGAIVFAPVGDLMITALKTVKKGGTVVSAGIHMSNIPSFPYSLLWEERTLTSVANLTRQDGEEFLALAPKVPIKTEVAVYSLEEANQAIEDFRKGKIVGSAVLKP